MKKTTMLAISIIVLIILGIIAFSIFNTGNKAGQNATIKIGAALGLTGDASDWAEASLNGAKIAVEEINQSGGVKGKAVDLIVEDTKSTAKDSVLAVSKLQDIDNVDALLVTWLDVYHGAESILKPGKIMITPDGGIEAINEPVNHAGVFSTWYRTAVKSDLAVKHMAEHGKKKLYIMVQNDSYYTTAANFMKESAKKYGVEVVGVDMINKSSDIKTTLAKIDSKNVDAIFFAFYDDQTNLEFLRRKSYYIKSETAIYGDEFVAQSLSREDLNGLLDGIYFYAPRNPDSKFYDSYIKKYRKAPAFGASTSYDAVYIIAKELTDSPKSLDRYMKSTKFQTASYGEASFDKLGGVISSDEYFEMKQIINGEAVSAN